MIFFLILIIFHQLYLIIQFGWALNYSALCSGAQTLVTVLRSRAEDMTITIVIINSKEEMGLECGVRHDQKRWAKNLRI